MAKEEHKKDGEKSLFTPQRAEQIQDSIYHTMSAEKKVWLTSQFFVLGRELNKSQRNDAPRITSKNN
jgi:hypothetical protein